jgi:hypothetical protein
VKELLNCNIARFPIRYLGLQLALRPLTKAEWQPILDKAVNFIPAWQRGLIARPGRLILINSVIMPRIIHHLLIVEAPVWLLDEIVKWLRAFFWAGKKEVNGGQCLMSWADICQSTQYAGLGIKDMKLQGLALRVRWEWLARTDSTRPWQGLPMLKDDDTRNLFQSLAKIEIGNGRSVWFWTDRWIDGRTAAEIAP